MKIITLKNRDNVIIFGIFHLSSMIQIQAGNITILSMLVCFFTGIFLLSMIKITKKI